MLDVEQERTEESRVLRIHLITGEGDALAFQEQPIFRGEREVLSLTQGFDVLLYQRDEVFLLHRIEGLEKKS